MIDFLGGEFRLHSSRKRTGTRSRIVTSRTREMRNARQRNRSNEAARRYRVPVPDDSARASRHQWSTPASAMRAPGATAHHHGTISARTRLARNRHVTRRVIASAHLGQAGVGGVTILVRALPRIDAARARPRFKPFHAYPMLYVQHALPAMCRVMRPVTEHGLLHQGPGTIECSSARLEAPGPWGNAESHASDKVHAPPDSRRRGQNSIVPRS